MTQVDYLKRFELGHLLVQIRIADASRERPIGVSFTSSDMAASMALTAKDAESLIDELFDALVVLKTAET